MHYKLEAGGFDGADLTNVFIAVEINNLEYNQYIVYKVSLSVILSEHYLFKADNALTR